jgi:hypothetical protein
MSFWLSILLAAQALASTPGNRPDQQGQAGNNQQIPWQVSPTPQRQRITSPVNNRPPQEEKKQPNRQTHYIRRAAAPEYLSQWVLVVIGAAGVIFGLKSLGLLRKQVKLEADALMLARISADAAKESADVARQSLHTLERARSCRRSQISDRCR